MQIIHTKNGSRWQTALPLEDVAYLCRLAAKPGVGATIQVFSSDAPQAPVDLNVKEIDVKRLQENVGRYSVLSPEDPL